MELKIGKMASLNLGGENNQEEKPKFNTRKVSEEELFEYYGQRQEFVSWTAHPKVTKTHLSKRAVRSLSIIGVVVGILLALMGEFWLLVLIVSIIFFANVLNKMEPEEVAYSLSNYGIRINDVDYHWFSMKSFFVYDKDEERIMAFDTNLPFPRRIFLTLTGQVNEEELINFCKERIPMLKEPPTDAFDDIYKKVLGKFEI